MKRPKDATRFPAIRPISRRKFLGETAGAAALTLSSRSAVASMLGQSSTPVAQSPDVTLRVNAAHAVNAFDPDKSLCSSMDILSREGIEKVYTPEIVKVCLSAGYGAISYRLHTPETIDYWHWNPDGQWTDPEKRQGYFIGNSEPAGSIRDSFGYSLPHRGCTHNGGTNRGYSRLTDGNPTTFWKSNPYLTSHFTGEDDSLHPQWIIIDFGSPQNVNAIRIHWCEPSAREYEVEYWTGNDPMNWEEPAMDSTDQGGQYLPVGMQANGRWNLFPSGLVRDGKGGTETRKLAEYPVSARYVRVVMTKSSNQPGPHGSDDVRHRVGYAIYEVYAGVLENGTFTDAVKHAPDGRAQTATYCSSTDPWHTAEDMNHRGDQTGIDLFFTSGITNNLPALITIPLIFSVPEDATAMAAYLRKRGYPIAWVEMDEEADGQYYMPEDYAALYIQFADAIHKADPTLKLGGPVFQGINQDVSVWPDAQGRTSWFGRFYDYLKSHGRQQDLTFASFEIYPYDACAMKWDDLFRCRELTRTCLRSFWQNGLPKEIPLMNSESNLSGSLSRYMCEIFSALWLADNVGSFFEEGGAIYIHSPIQPGPLEHGCQGWATWGNTIWNRQGKITAYTAFYHASRLINFDWVQHSTGIHHLFPVQGTLQDSQGRDLITAYAVHRPDNQWALMLINKDQENAHSVEVAFEDGAGSGTGYFSGQVHYVTYGSEQYVWHGETAQAHADPDELPRVAKVAAGKGASITLPKASVTVIRGEVTGLSI